MATLALAAPSRAQVSGTTIVAGSTPIIGTCTSGFNLYNNSGVVGCQASSGSGTVTGATFTGGLISVTGSTTLAFTVAGTSGGIPYFSGASTWASSGALTAGEIVLGGGAGAAPTPFAFGTANQCLTTNAGATALAWASCGGGGGSPGGTNGQLQYNNSSAFGGFTLGGDCTFSVPNITCTTLNGQAGPASAIVGISDSQTLANKSIAGPEINSGTVALARMPTVLGMPGYTTGASMWYGNPFALFRSTSGTGVTNSYYCYPDWAYQTVTVKALGITVVATSTGNTSAALDGALYNDLVTTGNVHRPGTLIDYTASFATGSAVSTSAALNNGTDTITGPALIWDCVQKFDATATYTAVISQTTDNPTQAIIGSATLGNVIGANIFTAVSTTGTGYGSTNWVNFTSSTTWTELTTTAFGPVMAKQVN